MNNKGQATTVYFLMIGIVIVILALAFAPGLKSAVDTARGNQTSTQDALNCGNITNDWQRGTCFASDIFLPYFFFGMIGIALAIIGAKIIT